MRLQTLLLLAAAVAFHFAAPGTAAYAMGGRSGTEPTLQNPAAWADQIDAAAAAGIDRERVVLVLARLEAAGYAVADTRSALASALQSARDGLPADWVLTKIGEGALKRVSVTDLQLAAAQRATLLQQASDLIENVRTKSALRRDLTLSTAMALESGVSEQVLMNVFHHATANARGGTQLVAIIQAGEAFALAGVDGNTAQSLMVDCLDRNLRRTETIRVVRYVRDNVGQGVTGAQLRASLWASSGTVQPGSTASPGQTRTKSGNGSGGPPSNAPGPGGSSGGNGGGPGSGHGGRH